jgi:glycosyltransferase involved in cell wall biosynthesis
MHVVAGLGAGGTEMMCLRLAQRWQNNFDQHIVAWSPSDRTLEAEFRNIKRCSLCTGAEIPQSYFQKWNWLRTVITRQRPDAVLIHIFGIPHLIVAAAARIAGVRSIAAWAGNPPPESSSLRRRYKAIVTASKFLRCPIVTCSRAVEQEFLKLGVGLPRNSASLPNGIDVLDISNKAGLTRQTQTHAPIIAMVSRLDAIKDHATLLNAFALVRLAAPEAQLWIIGDGAYRKKLERLAHELGIGDATMFLGNRTDVPNLLGHATIFAFSTTRDEGFGIALIEAMAADVPIVASNVAACREVLANGEAGMLVPPSDPERMSEAIIYLLDNAEVRRRLIEAGRRRVQSQYSIENCAQRWEAMLFGTQAQLGDVAPCAS